MSSADYGHIKILIDEQLKERKMSKNTLADKANLQRTQLNAYCNNKIKRPDFDVLSRICFALSCEINDILRYERCTRKVGQED